MNPLTLLAQARFPAPEFEGYTLPSMALEAEADDALGIRVAVLIVFLLLSGICFYRWRSRKAMVVVTAGGWAVFGYVAPPCPCPVGLFQNVAEAAGHDAAVDIGILLLFAIPLACALFFGRLYCSGACPLGAVQELLHWKTIRVPRSLDRVLRMFPFLLLGVFTVWAVAGMGYPLCGFDPYLPLFLMSFPPGPMVLAFVFVVVGLFISRPFCRYICPYGVLLRCFARFSRTSPQLTREPCVDCRLCEQGCPNGAIIPPETPPPPDIQKSEARRLARLAACVPLALAVGGGLGLAFAPVAASGHRDVRLLEALDAGADTEEVEAFAASGTPRAEVESRAASAKNTLMVGMCLAGMMFAGVVMAMLMSDARRRREESAYTIDGSLCFCCGRCYRACPVNRAARPGRGEDA